MDKKTKIYVAGHRGLVGSAIKRNLEQRGFTNVIGRTRAELDLLDPVAVREFFDRERPEMVVLAAPSYLLLYKEPQIFLLYWGPYRLR